MKASIFLGSLCFCLLTLCGCRETLTYNDYNGRTKAEIRTTWGEPAKVKKAERDLKHGADEVWIYPGKKGGMTSYLFFKDGIVVNYEVQWDVAL